MELSSFIEWNKDTFPIPVDAALPSAFAPPMSLSIPADPTPSSSPIVPAQPTQTVPLPAYSSPPAVQIPSTHHPMQTRSHNGMYKPNPRYANLHTTLNSPAEPRSIKSAKNHLDWCGAMIEELQALAINKTWELVPRTSYMNVIGCKWVYKAKLREDKTLERLKVRLVAKGLSQLDGVGFF